MEYQCEPCDYSSNDKSNFLKHNISKKHIKKTTKIPCSPKLAETREKCSKNVIDIFSCNFCNFKCSRMSNLTRHKNICADAIIENKNKEFSIIIENKNKEIDNLKKALDVMTKDKDALFKLTTDIQTTNNTSVSALNYVIQNHKKAPPLQQLDQKKAKNLLKFKDNDEPFVNDELVELLIYNFKKKNLDKCIGDMLLKHYKKNDPSEQSIWNSDTSRLTFLIKDIVGDKSEWVTDKKGVKLIKYVIKPVLELIIYLSKEYIQNQEQLDRTSGADENGNF